MAGGFVGALLRGVGRALFRRDDEYARQRGWQIQAGRFGMSRAYRHPDFDRLAACPDCLGEGSLAGADCGRCAGTGRVTLGQPSSSGKR